MTNDGTIPAKRKGIGRLLFAARSLALVVVLGSGLVIARPQSASAAAACTNPTLSANPAGPAVPQGKTVNFTAGATCGGTPVYEFWVGKVNGATIDWAIVKAYSTSNAYAWSTKALAL